MSGQSLVSASKGSADGNAATTVAGASSGPMSAIPPGQTRPRGDDLEMKQFRSQVVLAEDGETAALARQGDAYGNGDLDDRLPLVSDGNKEGSVSESPPIDGVAEDGFVHLEELISHLGGKATKPDRNAFVTVKKGDTLSRILTQFYGRYDNALLDAVLRENPGLDNFNRIQIGQIIKLPKDLLNQEQESSPSGSEDT
jgi:phage tail protein X